MTEYCEHGWKRTPASEIRCRACYPVRIPEYDTVEDLIGGGYFKPVNPYTGFFERSWALLRGSAVEFKIIDDPECDCWWCDE